MKKIIIVGAGGQGKNVSLLIEQIGGWEILGFIDDDPEKKGIFVRGYPVLGNIKEALSSMDEISIALAIGNTNITERIINQIKSLNKKINFPNLIHPQVFISEKDIQMGKGNIVNAGVVFTTDIIIGNYNYFNRCCSISHDVEVGDYCYIHSGVHLSGKSKINDKVWLGVNSTIIQRLNVGKGALIGAGTVVVKNVEDNAVMVGNPAKLLRYKE